MNPCGQEEALGKVEQMRHRAAAELAGARRSSPESGEECVSNSESPEGGLGLGHDRAGERVRGGQLG
jgi:hypothetical protein